jgi:hypothetical protein
VLLQMGFVPYSQLDEPQSEVVLPVLLTGGLLPAWVAEAVVKNLVAPVAVGVQEDVVSLLP